VAPLLAYTPLPGSSTEVHMRCGMRVCVCVCVCVRAVCATWSRWSCAKTSSSIYRLRCRASSDSRPSTSAAISSTSWSVVHVSSPPSLSFRSQLPATTQQPTRRIPSLYCCALSFAVYCNRPCLLVCLWVRLTTASAQCLRRL